MTEQEIINILKDRLNISLDFSYNKLKVKITVDEQEICKDTYRYNDIEVIIAEEEVDLSDLEPGANYI